MTTLTPVTKRFLKELDSPKTPKTFYVNGFATELNTTFSKMRTAFNHALAQGYIRPVKSNGTNTNLYTRTRKSIRLT